MYIGVNSPIQPYSQPLSECICSPRLTTVIFQGNYVFFYPYVRKKRLETQIMTYRYNCTYILVHRGQLGCIKVIKVGLINIQKSNT